MIVVVNKADNEKRELEGAEFHALGWEETYAISASHGRGTGDLLDAIVWALPPETEAELARKAREAEAEAWADEVAAGQLDPFVVGDPEAGDADDSDGAEGPDLDGVDAEAARWDAAMAAEKDGEPAAIAFVGRPNVGKSSLLNALLGEDRAIVSEIPGTTRDAIDTRLAWGRSEVVLIDTAGIRRRGKVAGGPAAERYSTLRALHALSRADVAVLVIDAVEGLTSQDAHVAGYVVEEGKGLVIAVNKWDLVEDKTDRTFDQYVEWIRNEVPFLDFAPIISISAKTGQRVGRVLEAAIDIWGERRKRISTGELNRVLSAATERTPPPPVRGHRPKLFYATQAAVAPPTFVFFASDASAVHFSYRRYLENRLRETFGFDGTPIRLVFRDRSSVKLPRRKKTRSAPSSRRPRARHGPRRRPARGHPRAADGRSARRGRRGGGVGDDARAPGRAGRAGDAPVPLPGDGGTDRRDRAERGAPAGGRPAGHRHRDGRSRRAPRRDRSRHLRGAVGAPADDGRGPGRRTWRPSADLLSVVKGLERGTLLRMSQVVAEAAGVPVGRVAALSGPNLAAEVARNLPASAVVAAADLALAERVVARLARRRFRLYVNEDILGVELCGALKNVVAIAAGAADGLGFGDNGKAGLLTRGLAEMTRLGIAAGANPLTFAGLAGMGDLIATAGSHPVAQPPPRRGAGQGPDLGRDRGDAARHRRGRLHRPGRARPRRAVRRRDADRPRGRARPVRGQERPALPGRPARPRVEGRAGRLRELDGAASGDRVSRSRRDPARRGQRPDAARRRAGRRRTRAIR